ncbi:hypothetical protein OAV66_05690 [Planktomarina temperata]|nr:hypothetical protein [Planktomarina temperata]
MVKKTLFKSPGAKSANFLASIAPGWVTLVKGDEIGVIESVKAASEIFAPVDGEIIEANELLQSNPAALNENPEADAWIYKVKLSDPSQLEGLMDLAGYKTFIS